MGRRTILIVAALVVAALGTTLVFVYVNGINNRALADQKPVQVLVAKTLIPAGMSVADASKAGDFELKEIATSSVAPNALSDIAPITGQVALSNIYAGEQILQQKFGAPGSTSELPIPGDKLAISIQLSDPARVAGFVQPGSNVAIFVSLQGGPGGGAAGGDFTRVLLPKAQVIAVGPTTLTTTTSTNAQTGQANTEQLPKAILTLALSQKDAAKLIFASQKGQLYFGLLTTNSKVDPGVVAGTNNLFN
jgi:pilus assembly protein CpaB